jgi:hypothetical protein
MVVIPNRVRVVLVVSALALAAGLLTLASLANPAQAKAQNFMDTDQSPTSVTLFSSCTGEPGELVFIEGNSNLVSHTTIDGNGMVHTRYHQTVQGQGEGDISGTKYVYTSVYNYDVYSTGVNYNFTNTHNIKLISQDSATDDMNIKLLSHVTVNDQGEVTAVYEFKSDCA